MIHRINQGLLLDTAGELATPALTSLEDRFVQTLHSSARSADHYKTVIQDGLLNPTGRPGNVLKLQMVSAEHTTRTTVISALAKKATSTIETLLKS